jgi:transcriptional regulator with XRE-family HTH domain
MAAETTGSTMPRRQLGRYLRELRNRERLTVKAAAEKLEWSEAKIWRIETGQTSLRSLDVEAMCKIYAAPADLTEALMGLARETKARGWWHAYGDVIPEGFDVYIGLEEAASQLAWYESELVPGLLQTEHYARTLIQADNPGVEKRTRHRVHGRLHRRPVPGQARRGRAVRPGVRRYLGRMPGRSRITGSHPSRCGGTAGHEQHRTSEPAVAQEQSQQRAGQLRRGRQHERPAHDRGRTRQQSA